MTGGTVTCTYNDFGSLVGAKAINKTGGTLNALASISEENGTQSIFNLIPYGSNQLVVFNRYEIVNANVVLELGAKDEYHTKLNIIWSNTLTIPSGSELNLDNKMTGLNIGDYVTNNGKLINDAKIVLPKESTQEQVKEALAILKPTGMGHIEVVGNTGKIEYYTNSGEKMNVVDRLSLDVNPASGDGYVWEGNATDGFTLTLTNILVTNGDITLPDGVSDTIILDGLNVVEKDLKFGGNAENLLTIDGKGSLAINGSLSSYLNDGKGTITIKGGANVAVAGGISYRGEDRKLTVDGKDTSLYVETSSFIGADVGGLEVSNGAKMTSKALYYGVQADKGGVTVTEGSTLNLGCRYGALIYNGKLTVDSTSKLITNGSDAPFMVVDSTKSKEQNEMVSIANIPYNVEIASVEDNDNNRRICSVIPKGGALTVQYGNCFGTVTGKVTFAYKKKSSDDSSSGGGSASISSKYTITAKAEKGGTISPDGEVYVTKNADKTFTITPNKGYELKDVLVDGASVGKVTKYTFEDVTKAHTITASFVETKDEVKEEVKDEKKDENIKKVAFSDVKDGDWFKKAVEYVTEKGLMSGTSEQEFAPNLSTTRGMIVTILWRLEGQPSAKTKANFTDVADGEYYAEAVAWAAENNIVGGYGNGIFAPNDVITREQLASILYRYSKFKGNDTTQGGTGVKEFSDYSKLSSWAGESTAWAVNAGLISGTGNSQLDPQGSATRGQVASILMRYCEEVAK